MKMTTVATRNPPCHLRDISSSSFDSYSIGKVQFSVFPRNYDVDIILEQLFPR